MHHSNTIGQNMRIGFIATRLQGTDGVTLEVEKWAKILTKLGHEIYYCAGELGGFAEDGTLIPELHFADQTVYALSQRAFGANPEPDGDALADQIYSRADEMRAPLRSFIRSNKLDLIIVQNALTIPMNLPLGVSLTGLIAELGIDTIAHHHDFFWERQRYQTNVILDLLDTAFPAKLPNIQHVTINSIAKTRLKARRGIESIVIPNMLDFATQPPKFDDYNKQMRSSLNLQDEELFILQPTRVVQRKGIEMAIDIVKHLDHGKSKLLISHRSDDEGLTYWKWLKREASVMGVEVQLIDHLIGPERESLNDHKIYSLWDAYINADLITYPSLYEGFGNALLEAIYFKKPTVVNCYPVYNADIKPLGFEFIELNGFVDEKNVEKVKLLLDSPGEIQRITEKNFKIAQDHFSFAVLESKLKDLLSNL
jgi:glycosyltransferase involved in cell wall biosynthesis